jgi:hypothetical protein
LRTNFLTAARKAVVALRLELEILPGESTQHCRTPAAPTPWRCKTQRRGRRVRSEKVPTLPSSTTPTKPHVGAPKERAPKPAAAATKAAGRRERPRGTCAQLQSRSVRNVDLACYQTPALAGGVRPNHAALLPGAGAQSPQLPALWESQRRRLPCAGPLLSR